MGFIRQQEQKLALRFLKWQYQKLAKPLPGDAVLAAEAARIVDEAHRIARQRGKSSLAI